MLQPPQSYSPRGRPLLPLLPAPILDHFTDVTLPLYPGLVTAPSPTPSLTSPQRLVIAYSVAGSLG